MNDKLLELLSNYDKDFVEKKIINKLFIKLKEKINIKLHACNYCKKKFNFKLKYCNDCIIKIEENYHFGGRII